MNASPIGVATMRKEFFYPTADGEARLLLLINAFTGTNKGLEGRVKLAKLDFFLRYPRFLHRALTIRGAPDPGDLPEHENIENQMVRYRYGPWDPAYYSLLGRLIGKGLITTVPMSGGFAFKSTDRGRNVAVSLAKSEAWQPTVRMTKLLRRHLDLTGTRLKDFVYEHFPEVAGAEWGQKL
jgi:hypothetical protein